MSELCLGTMTFGEEHGFGADLDESRRMFAAFVDAGGNFIDTANMYTQGSSERFLAEFIAPLRARLVVASKFTMSTDPADPNGGGNSRKNLTQALDATLRRLRTDYLDLYWVHAWDQQTPLDEVLRHGGGAAGHWRGSLLGGGTGGGIFAVMDARHDLHWSVAHTLRMSLLRRS